MPFFDKLGEMAKNIGEKATDLAKNVGEKATDAIETQKLNSKISSAKSAIGEQYKKLGEFYYAKYSAGEFTDDSAGEYFRAIDEQNEIIAFNEKEIERIKTEKQFATPAASAEPEAEVPAEPEASTICPKCGASVAIGTKFCSECGEKIEA